MEASFFDQSARGGVVGVDEGFEAVQAEFAEAMIQQRRDGFGCEAFSVVGGVDHVADAGAFTADVAVVVAGEAEALIRRGVGYGPYYV